MYLPVKWYKLVHSYVNMLAFLSQPLKVKGWRKCHRQLFVTFLVTKEKDIGLCTCIVSDKDNLHSVWEACQY